jgi:hypothetical protein
VFNFGNSCCTAKEVIKVLAFSSLKEKVNLIKFHSQQEKSIHTAFSFPSSQIIEFHKTKKGLNSLPPQNPRRNFGISIIAYINSNVPKVETFNEANVIL